MILFNSSKQETHHSKANFQKLAKKLRSVSKVQSNKSCITTDTLDSCNVVVIGNPQTHFLDKELQTLHDFIKEGGSVAIFASEGGEESSNSNLNTFLSEYKITVENKAVVRSVYHKYLHPKHALIQNGIIQPEIGQEKNTPLFNENSSNTSSSANEVDETESSMSLTFVYPNGTTLKVDSPACTILSSGSTSYPVDCPLAAACEADGVRGKRGRLVVVGSADIFADDWIEKEENSQLCDVLFRFLLHQNVSFDPSKGRSDFEETECVPDISSLANLVKPCLQDNEPLPQDYKSLLCENLFGLNNNLIPDVIALYKRLNVPYEPLTLIEPHFECPHPPLRLATHQPRMLNPPPPALELFDLDECFLDERTKLDQIANRFAYDADLKDFIQEAGWIFAPNVIENEDGSSDEELLAKKVLHQVAKDVSNELHVGGYRLVSSSNFTLVCMDSLNRYSNSR